MGEARREAEEDRKRVRLAAKKSDEPLNGNIGRKMNERWDINDFK